jgi:polyisoprenoid-binding protein YceI
MMKSLYRVAFAGAVAAAALMINATVTFAQGASAAGGTAARKIVLSDRVGHNQFNWVSDAPLEKIQGTAEGVSGSLTIDPRNPASIRGTITASVATMKTGNNMRDGHLRGDQWLDAARFPQISFTIASVKNVRKNGASTSGDATGSFTMHGVTRTLTIPFTLQYMEESARTRQRAPGDLVAITADFTVALKDYDVAGSKGIVGSKVGETIEVSAQLFGSTGL